MRIEVNVITGEVTEHEDAPVVEVPVEVVVEPVVEATVAPTPTEGV
jgi:hypothetical protein